MNVDMHEVRNTEGYIYAAGADKSNLLKFVAYIQQI